MEKDIFIPIVIGNCAPFRLVLRDTDKWSPTLKEINSLSYDYVKLNRNSTNVEIGIRPFSLIIGFDGSLILPYMSPYNKIEIAVNLFNRFLGELLLGGIFSEAVIPDNVSFGHMIVEGYNYIDGGFNGLISNFHQSIRLKEVSNFDAIKLLEPITITTGELTNSYVKGHKIFKRLNHMSPNILLEGVSHYVSSNWAQSLILFWTNIEQLINQIWEEKVISQDMSKKRREFLSDFRTWTAAAKIEALLLTGCLNKETYDMLNTSRKTRNDFMHRTENIRKESVDVALKSLFQLISLIDSDYAQTDIYDNILSMINNHQRGSLDEHTKAHNKDVKYWKYVPPLPGHSSWGDKPFEIIEELQLKEIKHT